MLAFDSKYLESRVIDLERRIAVLESHIATLNSKLVEVKPWKEAAPADFPWHEVQKPWKVNPYPVTC